MESNPPTPLEAYRPPSQGSAVALGFFDGVHRGHQAILRGAVDCARRADLEPVAFTFANHPSTVLAPDRVPGLLSSQEERFRLIQALGLRVVWVRFGSEFSRMSAPVFAHQILQDRLGARAVSVGPNYRFGHGALGDAGLLRSMAGSLGFEVCRIPALESGGALVSSSRIRKMVRHGRMEAAAVALGRPYRLEALVEAGHCRGAGLGMRTANLRLGADRVPPATGVYAVWAGPAGDLRPGVASYGTSPTFGGGPPLLEVHLFDFEGDLYGRALEVYLMSRLREERRFPEAAALARQMVEDAVRARQALSDLPRPSSLIQGA